MTPLDDRPSPTSPSRWLQVKTVVQAALDRPAEDRASFVASECADDDLRLEVESLLAASEAAEAGDDFLVPPTAGGELLRGLLEGAGASLPGASAERVGAALSDRYTLERELGRGGMAVVYLARDLRHGRPVAIKMLAQEIGAALPRERLDREILVTARLQHPHILPLHDSGEVDGSLYYVMPFVAGGTLRERLAREGPLGVDDAVRLAGEAALALDHAHRHGIVHRDVKPENILLADGHVLLADFGIARTIGAALESRLGETLTRVGAVIGTPAYMSPEQAAGETELDARSDLFALACVLFELLTGRPPWTGGDARTLMVRRFTEPPASLAELRPEAPASLEEAIVRALALDPADRFATAAEFHAAITASLTMHAHASPIGLGAAVPAAPGPLVGRERELETARALLAREDVRLVTLTGAGGSGKTRLALELATSVARAFPDGVCFVDLAPLGDAAHVPSAIAQAVGATTRGGATPLAAAAAHVGARRVLLVLDNFEQVVDAAPAVAELLAHCPRAAALVTSRVRLRVRGEHEFFVAPLALPAAGADADALATSPAVALFLRRALEARPEMPVNDDAVRAAAEICARVDGLPLAIELAAARCRLLSPRAVLGRLTGLDALAGGARDLPERQRTLRGAIAWSYDLLAEREKALLRALGVFAGGAPLEALGPVAGVDDEAVLDAVQSLADASLVRRSADESGDARVVLLDTIRAYAAERLRDAGEEGTARARHASWYRELATREAAKLGGPEEGAVLAALDRERDNLRVALDESERAPDAGAHAEFVLALSRLWLVRGRFGEGRERIARVLARATAIDRSARASLLASAGTLAQNQGDYASAGDAFAEALACWRSVGDATGIARGLTSLGWICWRRCEYHEARRLSRQGLERYRVLGDARGEAQALNNLGWVAMFQGEVEAAVDHLSACLASRRRLGQSRDTAFVLTSLAWTAAWRADLPASEALLAEALALFGEVGERQLLAFARRVGCEIALLYDTPADAARAARVLEADCLPIVREVGDRWGLMYYMGVYGDALQQLGRMPEAVAAYSESLALAGTLADRHGMASARARLAICAMRRGDVAAARELAGDARSLLAAIGGALWPTVERTLVEEVEHAP